MTSHRADLGGQTAGWYGWALGGLVPLLVLGFLASAAADRLIFAGWAIGFAALYLWALRARWRSRAAGGSSPAPWVVLAAAGLSFLWLAVRYAEALRRGAAALMPPSAS